MSANVTHTVDTEQAMSRLGAGLAGRVRGGCVVFLSGDLGAGKTTLVRGFLQALGHRGPVTSPTFTLLETYAAGGLEVAHVDLYRLEAPDELEALALRDYLGPDCVLIVEWPDRARAGLPAPDCEAFITVEPQGRRGVRIEGLSEAGEAMCAA